MTTPALFWLALALVFAIAEVATAGVVAAFPALGALAAAAAAILGLGPVGQVVIFAAVTVLGLVAARRPIMRYLRSRSSPLVRSGAASMIGARAVLTESIGADHRGHVRIQGESWPARTSDGLPLAAGEQVRVVRIEGATLIVEPAGAVPAPAPPTPD